MKYIIKTLFVLMIFSSCEGNSVDVVDINDLIIDNSTETKYIIEGQITDHSSKHHIIITKPSIIANVKGFEGVSKAIVTLSDGINTWTFSELPANSLKYKNFIVSRLKSGIYESDEYFTGFENKTYILKVIINGITYSAQETMPTRNVATEAEFSILRNTRYSHVFGQEESSIWNNNEEDREGVVFQLNGFMNFHDRIETEGLHAGGDTRFNSIFQAKVIRKYSITDGFSDFRWSFFSQTDWQGSIFSAEPSKLHSNFNNSEIEGYFSTVSSSFYDVTDGKKSKPELQSFKVFDVQKSYQAIYSMKGEVNISFSATGQCILKGLGQTMIGAYEILNNQWVVLHFPKSTKTTALELYSFYQVNIIGENLGLQYSDGTSLKSINDKIWKLL